MFSYDTLTAIFLYMNMSTEPYNSGNQELTSKIRSIACKLSIMVQYLGSSRYSPRLNASLAHPSKAYCRKSERKRVLNTQTSKINFAFASLDQAAKITDKLIQKWERYRNEYEGRSKTQAAPNHRNLSRTNRSVSTLPNKLVNAHRGGKCVSRCKRRNPKRKSTKKRRCRGRRNGKKRCKGKRQNKPIQKISKYVGNVGESSRKKRKIFTTAYCKKWFRRQANINSNRVRTPSVNRRKARKRHQCKLVLQL